MSFFRHARSIGPIELIGSAASHGGGVAFPQHPRPLRSVQGAIPRTAPCLIVRDESHRLSLGGLVSTSARLRFTGWVQHVMKWSCRSRNFQRTANSVLTLCLSQGDNRNFVSVQPNLPEFKDYAIESTTHLGCGYDFRLRTDANKDFLAVEVKGLSERTGSLSMTPKEHAVATALTDRFFLFVVKNFHESPFHEIYQNPLVRSLQFKRCERITVHVSWLATV